MNFQTSDKVVCVVSEWDIKEFHTILGPIPQKGTVYVVESIIIKGRRISFRLVGSTAWFDGLYGIKPFEVGWDSTGFRKLEDIKRENSIKCSSSSHLSTHS
jgi:hypothetical protein